VAGTNEQKLVDICFAIGLHITEDKEYWKNKSREEVANWIRDQLTDCGFETIPMGASWGVLKKNLNYRREIVNLKSGIRIEIYEPD
jgi:hypothetical protein